LARGWGEYTVIHTLHGPVDRAKRRLFALIDERIHVVAISRAQRAGEPRLHYAGVVYTVIDLATHPFNPSKRTS